MSITITPYIWSLSPPSGLNHLVASCAGLRLPGTETGEPFGSPTQPTINRECDCANDMKKDAGASHIAP
ncbi:hypothetical protein E0V34_23490 [Escherichia coli]|nr:hypothetical protein [Shigella flexneri]EGO8354815.1 hypothetical protein [Escherichia coli]MMW96291.1 hypothetical protein [Shigella flexneri]